MLDLVEHLADWMRGGPLVLLALARPELRDRRPELVEAGGPSCSVVVLGALDATAGRQLAYDILDADELPEPVVVRAVEASEGNPLFLRELLRLLVDDGVLVRLGRRWTATVEVDAIELPATIHAALAARIEQLDADTREVLQAASVIGRHFARGAVADLLPAAIGGRLDEHLGILHRRGLVDPEGTWWADERLFQFHHALIRDAAYRRVLKQVRAELHERYADWLAAKVGDATAERDEVLGWHLEQAHVYRVALGEVTDARLVERAVGHLAAAGRRALERDDVANAASLLGRALRLAPGDAGLMRDRCEALVSSGDTRAASEAVAALAAAAGDERAVAFADVFDAQLAGLRSPDALRESVGRTAAAARVLAEHGDDAGVAKAESVHAVALAGLGQVAACEAALDRALAAARRAGDRRRANVVLAIAPVAALWGPSPVGRASGRCLDVIRVLRITSWAPQVEAEALRCQAVLEAMRDRPDAARRMLDAARAAFTTLGSRLGLLETALHAGQVELLAGAPGAAEAHLREAIAGFDTFGARVAAARGTALLARALLELGRVDEAEAIADPSLAGDDLKAAIGLLGVRAEVLARQGHVADAEVLARRAVQLAEATDALVEHADARVALARVLVIGGQDSESAAELARAHGLYEAKGSVVGARLTGLAPSARSDMSLSPPTARPNAASALFEEYLSRLNAGALPDETICGPGFLVEDHVFHIVQDLASVRASRAGTLGWRFDGELVSSLGRRCCVYRYKHHLAVDVNQGGVSSGETTRLVVVSLDGTGRFDRCHTFGPGDHDAAIAMMNDLHTVLDGPERRVRPNLATAGLARWAAAMRAGDASAVLAAHAPGYVNLHHRMHNALSFEEQRGAELEIAGRSRVEVQALATLGERHALHRLRMEWADDTLEPGSEPGRGLAGDIAYDLLLVSRTDRDGAALHTDMFESEQLALGVACLVERWAEDELGEDERARAVQWAEGWHYAETINAQDWARRESQLSDDIVLIDHRPATVGELRGSAAVTDWERTAVEAADRLSVQLADILALTENATLVRGETTGSVHEGSFEIRSLIAASFGPDGRFDRLEYFAEDQPAAAWAAFERMERIVPQLHSALALRRRWANAARRADLNALRDVYTPEALTEDRRSTVQVLISGREAHVARVAEIPAGTVIDFEELATAGPRLALLRARAVTSGIDVAEWLLVQQLDVAGQRFEHTVIFESADLDGAHDGLTERLALLAGDAAEVVRTVATSFRAWSSGDPDRLRAGFAPAASVVDHRTAGWGSVDLDGFIERTKALYELSEQATTRLTDVPALRSWGMLSQAEAEGRWSDGVEFVWVQWSVHVVSEGRITHLELFPIDQYDAAEACLERFRPIDNRPVANGACRWMRTWADAFLAHDLEALASMYRAHAVVEDRRPLMRAVFRGPAENVRNVTAVFDAAGADIGFETEVLATRTARLALFHNSFVIEAGDVDILFLAQLDEEACLLEQGSVYDGADREAAYAELDERCADLAGDAGVAVLTGSAVLSAFNARDAEKLETCLADTTVFIDHRSAGWEETDAAGFVARSWALFELCDWIDTRMVETPRLEPWGMLSRCTSRARWRDGAVVAVDEWWVSILDHGEIARLEQFAHDDRQLAEACLDRQRPSVSNAGSNAATRSVERWSRSMARGDLDTAAKMCTPDIIGLDRRPLTRGEMIGAVAYAASNASMIGATGCLKSRIETIATRGQRLALMRLFALSARGRRARDAQRRRNRPHR